MHYLYIYTCIFYTNTIFHFKEKKTLKMGKNYRIISQRFSSISRYQLEQNLKDRINRYVYNSKTIRYCSRILYCLIDPYNNPMIRQFHPTLQMKALSFVRLRNQPSIYIKAKHISLAAEYLSEVCQDLSPDISSIHVNANQDIFKKHKREPI